MEREWLTAALPPIEARVGCRGHLSTKDPKAADAVASLLARGLVVKVVDPRDAAAGLNVWRTIVTDDGLLALRLDSIAREGVSA